MKRMWQLVASCDERNSLIASGRLLTVLLRIASRSAALKGLSPRIPTTMGEFASVNASGGHSTNFAKFKRNTALRRYSDGGGSCAWTLAVASSRTEHRTRIGVAQPRMSVET